MIVTVDLGTTFTKVALWDSGGLVAEARKQVETNHPEPGWAEQDPSAWWSSTVGAFGELHDLIGTRDGAIGSVEALGCTGARQTIVLVDAAGHALGPALAWTDRRAPAEADALAVALGGPDIVFDRTGVPIDAGSVAAKLAWLTAHDPERMEAAARVLAPRDYLAWQMTGEVATDPSMASRTGLYDLDGRVVTELAGDAASKLAPVIGSGEVTGRLAPLAASELGLAAGTPVVIGAGDRACEVLGTGASGSCPMVSWGTTANISTPLELPTGARPTGARPTGARPTGARPPGARPPGARPPGIVLSRAADGGWLLEGGLSSAGSFLQWLGRTTGRDPASLSELARQSPPGARGVVAVPWLDGARAPTWNSGARAGFVGLSSDHGLADLSRALIESVGWEVKRCLDAMSVASGVPPFTELALAGTGAGVPVWVEVLTGITGLPAWRRRSGQAASAGAALLASSAVGAGFDLETIDPVDDRIEPDPRATARYADLREDADRVADRLLDLTEISSAGSTGDMPCG